MDDARGSPGGMRRSSAKAAHRSEGGREQPRWFPTVARAGHGARQVSEQVRAQALEPPEDTQHPKVCGEKRRANLRARDPCHGVLAVQAERVIHEPGVNPLEARALRLFNILIDGIRGGAV
jgi:hypothetical protein